MEADVSPEGSGPSASNHGFTRILVPLDGSALAERALEPAETLARAFGGQVILLHATTPIQTIVRQLTPIDVPVGCDPDEIASIEREQSQRYLGSVAQRLKDQGLDVREEIREGRPAEVICATARETHADVIAVTTHGRGGWRHLMFGSVAEEIIRHAACPVLVVHITQ